MLRLEVIPKAVYHQKDKEALFYRTYFDDPQTTILSISDDLIEEAQTEAENLGLSAVDALHIVTARKAGVEEFVTGEKRTKPLFRVSDILVTSIWPSDQ